MVSNIESSHCTWSAAGWSSICCNCAWEFVACCPSDCGCEVSWLLFGCWWNIASPTGTAPNTSITSPTVECVKLWEAFCIAVEPSTVRLRLLFSLSTAAWSARTWKPGVLLVFTIPSSFTHPLQKSLYITTISLHSLIVVYLNDIFIYYLNGIRFCHVRA